jgi:hypothetical protein
MKAPITANEDRRAGGAHEFNNPLQVVGYCEISWTNN